MGYLGSKNGAGVYQAIIALMPPHETFVDLFVGSGAILTNKPLAVHSYAVDLNATMLEALPSGPQLTKVCTSARSFLDDFDYGGSGRVLIYADPPYVHSTRTSRHRYKFEMTDADHLDLLAQLRAVPCNVILSGYPSALYESNLPGWNTKDFQAMTRGGVRTERLWFNFEPCSTYSSVYAGSNFTDRQRIKRKAESWARKYSAMAPGERMAVLSAILAANPIDESDDAAGPIVPVDYRRRRLGRPSQLPLTMHDRTALPPMFDIGETKLSPSEARSSGGGDDVQT